MSEVKTIQIMSRYGGVLREVKADTLREALEIEARTGADLSGANLSGADLRGADPRWADLNGAYLNGAYLNGAKLNWQSHALLAEILRRAAGDDVQKRMVAGLIAISTDWCWDEFIFIETPLRDWALDELAKWVQDGDGAPACVRERVTVTAAEVAA